MRINEISLSKLEYIHMPFFMRRAISALKDNDVEKLNLEFQLKILEENQKKIITLDPVIRAHPLTGRIAFWHEQTLNLASSILSQTKGISRANMANLKKEAEIAENMAKMYLKGIRRNNRSDIETLIDIFTTHVNKNPEVNNAFNKIGLIVYVNELQLANETYNRLYRKRQRMKIKIHSRDENKRIVKEAQEALRSFFDQLNIANRIYPELNYKPLMMELNTLIAEFTNIIKTRETYNKKRALKAKKEKEAALASKKEPAMKLNVEDNNKGIKINAKYYSSVLNNRKNEMGAISADSIVGPYKL